MRGHKRVLKEADDVFFSAFTGRLSALLSMRMEVDVVVPESVFTRVQARKPKRFQKVSYRNDIQGTRRTQRVFVNRQRLRHIKMFNSVFNVLYN